MTIDQEHGRTDTLLRVPTCKCGEKGILDYSDKSDAYYCPVSGVWLEETCGRDECTLCRDRSEKHPV
jgi:hypothetical protein